jgi:hypothetical protein
MNERRISNDESVRQKYLSRAVALRSAASFVGLFGSLTTCCAAVT